MRTLIVDDHPLYARAVSQVVEQLAEGSTAHVASSAGELSSFMLGGLHFDLVLLDLVLPDMTWEQAIVALRRQWPGITVVAISAFDDPRLIERVMEAGANGFIAKTVGADQLQAVLRTILSGGRWQPGGGLSGGLSEVVARSDEHARLALLTERQRGVLRLLAVGQSNKEIARELGISIATVKLHVNAVLRRLQVSNRTEAAGLFLRSAPSDATELSRGSPRS